MIDWKKYILVFFITTLLFLSASALSNYFNNERLLSLKNTQDKIAIDILSSETQFSLLSELSCTDIQVTNLSSELNSLAARMAYAEQNVGDSDEFIQLKKYYTLLQIKDYLLIRKMNERCGEQRPAILYFYTTAENCSECVKQGYVLSALREQYPELRVYSFDYTLSLSALDALLRIYKIQDTKLPAVVINEQVHTGFQEKEFLLEKLQITYPEDTNEVKE